MIIISPYSKPLRNGKQSAKTYPYWDNLIMLLSGKEIVQIGVEGERQLVPDFRKNLTFKQIKSLLTECDCWISVDNFLQHLAHHIPKPGIVLWGISDPLIFGYPENTNLLKDRRYLRENQFDYWENYEFNPDVFVLPAEVAQHIKTDEWCIK